MPYADPAVKLAKDRAYKAARREQLAAKQRDYYQRTREERDAKSREYLDNNPEIRRAIRFANRSNQRAREWKADAAKIYAADLLREIPLDFCRYCGAEPSGWDHVVPLCRGGANAISNLVPACLSCNRRKGRHVWRPSDFDSVREVLA